MPFLLVAPIASAAIAAGASATAAAFIGQAGAAIAGIGLSYGLSSVLGAMNAEPAPKAGAQKREATGEETARVMAFGRCATAGQRVYSHRYGPDKGQLQVVFRLADHRCRRLVSVVADGTPRALTAIGTNLYRVEGYDGRFEIRWHDGSPNQAAEPQLITRSGGRWTSAHRLRSNCYVTCDFEYRATTFPTGAPPQLLFIFDGGYWYDPRRDTTRGGSGPQRWDKPSTWEYSDTYPSGSNPVIAALNYALGNWQAGKLWGGIGWDPNKVDWESVMAEADICDQSINGGKRYRISYLAPGGDQTDHKRAMSEICAAMHGAWAVRHAGLYIQAGAARSPVATLTDADFMPGTAAEPSDLRGAGEGLCNELAGSWTGPAKFKTRWIDPVAPPADRTADGGEMLADTLAMPAVTVADQANRILNAEYLLRRLQASDRRQVRHQHRRIEELDIIQWTSAENGWTKQFRVEKVHRTFGQGRKTVWELREWSSDIYVNPGTYTAPPDTDGDGDPDPPVAPSGFDVDPVRVTGDTAGEQVPGALFRWTPPLDRRVTAVHWQIRGKRSKTVTATGLFAAPEFGTDRTTAGLGPKGTFQARIAFVYAGERYLVDADYEWTAWQDIVSEGTVLPPDPTPPGVPGLPVLSQSSVQVGPDGNERVMLRAVWGPALRGWTYDIEYSVTGQGGTIVVGGRGRSWVLPVGRRVTVRVRIYAVSQAGVRGTPTAWVSFFVDALPPRPVAPTIRTVKGTTLGILVRVAPPASTAVVEHDVWYRLAAGSGTPNDTTVPLLTFGGTAARIDDEVGPLLVWVRSRTRSGRTSVWRGWPTPVSRLPVAGTDIAPLSVGTDALSRKATYNQEIFADPSPIHIDGGPTTGQIMTIAIERTPATRLTIHAHWDMDAVAFGKGGGGVLWSDSYATVIIKRRKKTGATTWSGYTTLLESITRVVPSSTSSGGQKSGGHRSQLFHDVQDLAAGTYEYSIWQLWPVAIRNRFADLYEPKR